MISRMKTNKRNRTVLHADQNWTSFHRTREVKKRYPQWPNEAMLKVIFGRYLKHPIKLGKNARILDVGCGFGQNLIPFLSRGYAGFGTEVTSDIASLTENVLRERGFKARVREGKNTQIPFPSRYFDLLLSINVLHYEKTGAEIRRALSEYQRVLKPGGSLLLMTVGPEHVIYKRARKVGPHQYQIQNYDFRNGEQYFYFDDQRSLKHYLKNYFSKIELGRVTERLMTHDLDFLLAVGRARKARD